MSSPFRRYGLGARWYDVLSGERAVYRAGRVAGIADMHLSDGDVVIDLGCGTGLNFPLLHDAVGASGAVIGIDLSTDMLDVARRRVRRHGWANVRLIAADASRLDASSLGSALGDGGADALITTYALSVMREGASAAFAGATGLLRPGATVCVVDMQPPTGRWRLFSPLARLACALGGADIAARPWRLLEAVAVPGSVRRQELRGGHIVAVTGSLPGSA
ncbi:class I SAM-dependent methyltransferase [Planococcus sp. APC 4015]|nr:class I SAM-dependent methyltransferase [Planococcus sp. APC 4015]